jgi:hypothetical protein
MRFSLATVAVVLLWTWLLAPRLPDRFVMAIGAVVILLAIRHNLGSGEWGFRWRALGGASWRALLVTVPAVVLILAVGAALGTLHDRHPRRRVVLVCDLRSPPQHPAPGAFAGARDAGAPSRVRSRYARAAARRLFVPADRGAVAGPSTNAIGPGKGTASETCGDY